MSEFSLKLGLVQGRVTQESASLRMMSLEVEGDTETVNAALRGFAEGFTATLPADAEVKMLEAPRVQRCSNCGVLGHKRPTCEQSGGGRGPA